MVAKNADIYSLIVSLDIKQNECFKLLNQILITFVCVFFYSSSRNGKMLI